jgi:hypothetical protein
MPEELSWKHRDRFVEDYMAKDYDYVYNRRLCKVKMIFHCYDNRQTDLATALHVLIYSSFSYKENNHQTLQFCPLCIRSLA